jgi:hypothetical protein
MSLYDMIIRKELKFNFIEYFFHLLLHKVIFFEISFICSNNDLRNHFSHINDVCVYYLTKKKLNKDFFSVNVLIGFTGKPEDLNLTLFSQELQKSFEEKKKLNQVIVLPIYSFVRLSIYFEKLISNCRYSSHDIGIFIGPTLKKSNQLRNTEAKLIDLIEMWELKFTFLK